MRNRQVILSARPHGIPTAEHFTIVDGEVPPLAQGQVLVRAEFWSADPVAKSWTNLAGSRGAAVNVGDVMWAYTAGTVVESRDPQVPVGTQVTGNFGWQEFAVTDASKFDWVVADDAMPLSLYLGVLGLTGGTGWFGLLEVGQPVAGETVAVSTAAGAVGSVVGQVAKARGCRTVGIAGGPQKVQIALEEFGYDACVDYKSPTFVDDLVAATPSGVDLYFDNTAGPISDAVHQRLNVRARCVICGTASVASWDPTPLGPRVERLLLTRNLRMQGMSFGDYRARRGEAIAGLSAMIASGELRYREEFLHGIEACPDSVAGLYRGENLGKRIIRALPQDA